MQHHKMTNKDKNKKINNTNPNTKETKKTKSIN